VATGRVGTAAKWERGDDRCSSRAVNAMRRERLGHRDQSGAQDPPGEGPPPNGAHELRSADAPSCRRSTLARGGLGGGVRRCVTRHLLPWRWGRNRAATPCAPAQLQHPRRAGPPSRPPIRPKRAAISRLLAQNLKRNLARLENREIAGVLERGAGLITAASFTPCDE
jgi:hypothetical protein